MTVSLFFTVLCFDWNKRDLDVATVKKCFTDSISKLGQGFFLIMFVAVSVLLCFTPTQAIASDDTDSAEIVLSSENDAASSTQNDFAIDAFWRAQVGSNRDVDGVYYGYSYYSGLEPSSLAVIASGDFVVVYVSPEASSRNYDTNNIDHQTSLKKMISALDAANANGSTVISEDVSWYFTQDARYSVNEIVFEFNRELKEGQFFSSVIGSDGSDITKAENPYYVRLTHADFASLVDSDNVELAVAATGWDAFVEFLANIDYSPLWVTLKTTGVAIVFIFVLGLAAAYFSLRIPSRAQDVFDAIFTIPMVLPPTVCGFLLLLALGRNSPVGEWFIDIGFPLIFSWPATVIAAVVVAFPLMYRSARGAFESLDQDMLDAARTLGWSNGKVFIRLMLPLAWSSIAAGTVLALARALGEFGATLFLAGNYLGITRTIPIAIYFEWMNGNLEVAIFWTVVIIVFCLLVIIFINIFSRRTTQYRKAAKK